MTMRIHLLKKIQKQMTNEKSTQAKKLNKN